MVPGWWGGRGVKGDVVATGGRRLVLADEGGDDGGAWQGAWCGLMVVMASDCPG